MESIGTGIRSSRPEHMDEASRVIDLERQLRKCEAFVRDFTKEIVQWIQAVRVSQTHLREWTIDFGKTIGISEEQPSEAFDAFMSVIDTSLLPLCTLLEDMVSKELLLEFARLLDTTKSPLRLLSAMHSLEPKTMRCRACTRWRSTDLFDEGIVVCI